MSELFGRAWSVQVGQPGQRVSEWSQLRTSFRVTKTTKKEPNKAEIRVYNLSPDSISRAQEKNAIVRLMAGYQIPQTIFLGDIDSAEVERSRTDTILKIQAQDGGRQYRKATLDKAYAPGTALQEIFDDLFRVLGLPKGAVKVPTFTYSNAVTINGHIRDTLDRLVASLGLEWFIMDGAIQVFKADATPNRGPLVSANTGMIGSPQPWTDEKQRTGVEVRSLMLPSIQPSNRFELRSKQFNGFYRADEVEHIGDSHANDWYTVIRARVQ